MNRRVLLVACALAADALLVRAQGGLDPKKLLNPGTDSWPTYNGDYSGRRFSPLTKITAATNAAIKAHLEWISRVTTTRPRLVLALSFLLLALALGATALGQLSQDSFSSNDPFAQRFKEKSKFELKSKPAAPPSKAAWSSAMARASAIRRA